MKLTKERIDLLLDDSREERAYATAKSFKLFCIFYFTKYFSYQPAPFHDDFFQDFEDLTYGRVKDAAWLAYRESAKTSIAKMGLVWIIARKQIIDSLRMQGEEVSHWGERLSGRSADVPKRTRMLMMFPAYRQASRNLALVLFVNVATGSDEQST